MSGDKLFLNFLNLVQMLQRVDDEMFGRPQRFKAKQMTHAVRIPGSVREKCHSSEKLLIGSSTEGLARAKKKQGLKGKMSIRSTCQLRAKTSQVTR